MLERIVAEVVRRLSQLADAPPPTAHSSPAAPPAPPAPAPPIAPDTLVLDARVVSLDTIRNRLKGIRTVVVAPQTIVTPSVKDELDKRHIRLELQQSSTQDNTSWTLNVIRLVECPAAVRTASALPLPAEAVELHGDDLASAVSAAAHSVSDPRQLSVMLTDSVMAAVCQLNRSAHVRAAHVRSVEEARQAVSAIAANALVIDPRNMNTNRWNAIIKAFRTGVRLET